MERSGGGGKREREKDEGWERDHTQQLEKALCFSFPCPFPGTREEGRWHRTG